MPITLTAINIYPVKSCRGITLHTADLDRWGLQSDRNWMVVNSEGKFLSQREVPRLALVETTVKTDELHLRALGQETLVVPVLSDSDSSIEVEVWGHRCRAIDQGETAAVWLSNFLGLPCRLVRIGADYDRPVGQAAAVNAQVGFADAYPLLLISEASLADLNQRLPAPLPMNRFRPNLVVSGCEPYAEDSWRQIRINQILFDVAKPCERCIITTTNQTTATREGSEPLKTLATYRKVRGGVIFGQNLIHHSPGTLQVGNSIEVLS